MEAVRERHSRGCGFQFFGVFIEQLILKFYRGVGNVFVQFNGWLGYEFEQQQLWSLQ